jgi:hypothetical protein
MIKRIKALNELEFESAKSGEAVYGKYKGLFVYIELGMEGEYQEKPQDDPKTQYRFFRQCKVEYSTTEEESEQGIYQYNETDVDLILYW